VIGLVFQTGGLESDMQEVGFRCKFHNNWGVRKKDGFAYFTIAYRGTI